MGKGKVFRNEGKWVITQDEINYLGKSKFESHFLKIKGEVSMAPSLGEKVTYTAKMDLVLKEDPEVASNLHVHTFLVSTEPKCYKNLVSNMLVLSQDQWKRTLIQHIRRGVKS